MRGDTHTFESRTALAESLAERIRAWAKDADGSARLELSGGSTPVQLLEQLAAEPLPAGLDVLPVDDRCVAVGDERSNAGMFQAALGAYRARQLYDENQGIGGSVTALNDAISKSQSAPRFTILGMGPDGHTASLFPGSPELAAGLDTCAPAFIAAQPTMEPMVPRITMSAPFILASDVLILHIHGQEKWALMEAAENSSSDVHPIAHFLKHPIKQMDVYYAD